LPASSGLVRAAISPKMRYSGQASATRGPGISGEKMTRRSVEVSVTPPAISYRVWAGSSSTSPAGSTSIWLDRQMSTCTRNGMRDSASRQ